MRYNTMLAAAVAACAWLSPAAGQTVYRCGDSYSQQPCPDARPVPAEDARTAAQRKESLQATQRDAQAAHRMEEARLKDPAYQAQLVEALANGIKRYFKRNPPLARRTL